MNKKHNHKYTIFIKTAFIFFVILKCDINMAERANFPIVDFSSSSSSKRENISFIWTIRNISLLLKVETEVQVHSRKFWLATNKDISFGLYITPNKKPPLEEYMPMFLWYKGNDPIYLNFRLILMNKFYKIAKYFAWENREFNNTVAWGIAYIMKKEEVFNPKNNILLSDTLILAVEISVDIKGVKSVKNDHIGNYTFSSNPLTEYFQPFIQNPKFSDVILVINGTELPAHTILLAAHSTVLSRMIQELTNTIHYSEVPVLQIHGVKLNVMKEVLTYMYRNSEKIQILEEQILKNCTSCFIEWSKEIYSVARKYDITKLKIFCEKYVFGNLNLDTAIGILTYMYKLRVNNIVLKIMKFIADQIYDFIDTDAFKKLKTTHPKLVSNIFQISVQSEGEIFVS